MTTTADEMGYALLEAPGLHQAPQTRDAAWVDAAVTGWLDRRLTTKDAS